MLAQGEPYLSDGVDLGDVILARGQGRASPSPCCWWPSC